MTGRILVACVGNIFKSDDGFGTAVAQQLQAEALPDGTRLVDFGIRSVHLVYELLDGYDVLVLVDTVAHQEGPPGTVYLIAPDLPDGRDEKPDEPPQVLMDPHDLAPGAVFELLPTFGGYVDRILVVGVQPETVQDGIGLSDPVQGAVEEAARMVRSVVHREGDRLAAVSERTS